MNNKLQQKLDRVIANVHGNLLKKNIVVPRYEKGRILVGDVSIVQNGATKNILQNDRLVYEGVFLNKVAIHLANALAVRKNPSIGNDFIYRQDQSYGLYMQETLFFDSKYKQALEKKRFDRADIYYARWQHAKEKAVSAKNYVLSLITS